MAVYYGLDIGGTKIELAAFNEKLEKLYPETKYVTRLMTYSWGQKVIRFYDLDGNLIEVRTPMRG